MLRRKVAPGSAQEEGGGADREEPGPQAASPAAQAEGAGTFLKGSDCRRRKNLFSITKSKIS